MSGVAAERIHEIWYNSSKQDGTEERGERSAVPGTPESRYPQWPEESLDHSEPPINQESPPPSNTADGSRSYRLSTRSPAFANGPNGQAPATSRPVVQAISPPRTSRGHDSGEESLSIAAQFPTTAPWPGTDDGDDGRRARGLAIAATCRIEKIRLGYKVPSQRGAGDYIVTDIDGQWLCSCPDFEERARPCKHIYAVWFHCQRENGDGIAVLEAVDARPATPAQPEPCSLDAPLRDNSNRKISQPGSPARKHISPATAGKLRPTYGQNWPSYNLCQKNEKAHFRHLLKALSDLAGGRVPRKGRRPALRSDQVFSLVYRCYTGMSWRRFDTDLREAQANGFIEEAMSTSSLSRYMNDQSLTPILHDLVLCSSLPMKPFERHFAIDATGFSSDRFARWFTEKWGKVQEVSGRDWAKLHLVCGTDTHIITSVEVSDNRDHDSRYLEPLVAETAAHFDMDSIAADKAYGSRRHYTFARGLGVDLFTPFKSNVVEPSLTDDSEWAKMFHWVMSDYDGWLSHYHIRSISEAVISTLKRLFGDKMDSRDVVAQGNELLCRVLAYNLVTLIHAMYERGLDPHFQSVS